MKTIFKMLDIIINRMRKNMIKHLFEYHINLNYACAEFGVYKGKTARYIDKYKGGRTLYLFDSFKGLPEGWWEYKKGYFGLKQVPPLPEYSIIYEGWFKDTLADFREDYSSPLSFIHIDSDLMQSALTVLEGLDNKIIPGTVILFDEYLRGEDEAFKKWLNDYARCAVMIKKTHHLQVAYMVTR